MLKTLPLAALLSILPLSPALAQLSAQPNAESGNQSAAQSGAQSNDCLAQLDQLVSTAFDLEQRMIRKDIDHNLVVEMSDGTAADLRGEEPRSQPLESWMDGVEGGKTLYTAGLSKAREFAEANDIENCLNALGELRQIIGDYDSKLGS